MRMLCTTVRIDGKDIDVTQSCDGEDEEGMYRQQLSTTNVTVATALQLGFCLFCLSINTAPYDRRRASVSQSTQGLC